MQFQAQAWAPGKKIQGRQIDNQNINEHCQTYFIFGF